MNGIEIVKKQYNNSNKETYNPPSIEQSNDGVLVVFYDLYVGEHDETYTISNNSLVLGEEIGTYSSYEELLEEIFDRIERYNTLHGKIIKKLCLWNAPNIYTFWYDSMRI